MPIAAIKNYIKNKYTEPVDKEEYGNDLRVVHSSIEYTPDGKQAKFLLFELDITDKNGETKRVFKAIRFTRVTRLPAIAKQALSFMQMHQQLLAGVWEKGINMVTVMANMIKPVPLGLLFLYGVQGIAETIEEAKRAANLDYAALSGLLRGTYRTMEFRPLNHEESEWLRDKMHGMKHLSVMRGLPKARPGGVDAGNRGIGNENISPEAQDTTEEFIAGMSDREYVFQIISTPVSEEVLRMWLSRTAKHMTYWEGLSEGNKSINFGISLPMIFMANLGASDGWNSSVSESENIGTAESVTEGESFTRGVSFSEAFTESVGRSDGVSLTEGVSESIGVGRSEGISESFGISRGFSESVSESEGIGSSESMGLGQSESLGRSESLADSQTFSNAEGQSQSRGFNESDSRSTSENVSINESQGTGENVSLGANQSAGLSGNQSVSGSTDASLGFKPMASASMGEGFGLGTGVSEGAGVSEGVGRSVNDSIGVASSVGNANAQAFGSSVGQSESQTVGESLGRVHGLSESQGWGASQSFGKSVSESFGVSRGASVSEGWSEGVGRSEGVSVSASQGKSAALSNTAATNESQSLSTSVGRNYSEGVNVSRGVTDSWGRSAGISDGVSRGISNGVSSNMGVGPSLSFAKSFQWEDIEVKNIIRLLEFQNNRLMRALNGDGAFFTDVYIATPDEESKSAAETLAKSAWHCNDALVCPLQVMDLSAREESHLLYHFAAFSPDTTVDRFISGEIEGYRYTTVLLPEEYTAYTHPPRISDGGIFADTPDIPKFAVPSMRNGEIYMGKVLSAERWTEEWGYSTPFDFRIASDEIMHGFVTGESRSGKTVAAMRFVAELANKVRRKNGKRMRIVCMDPKQDWRALARYVEPERFKFFSLGNPEFLPINLNLCKIPRNVYPQQWVDGLIEIYCRAYGLGERGKAILSETFFDLYDKAGVFVPNWREVASERSREVTLPKVYAHMFRAKQNLEGINSGKGKIGNDVRDAYVRVLDRLQVFGRPFSIEAQLFGRDDGIGIDDLIGNDDVTVLESYGLESTFKNFVFGAITSGFFKCAQAYEGGFLSPNQYETMLVIEEANEVLTGQDASDKNNSSPLPGQSEFERILDQSAGMGLFILSITQKIASMPSSIVANSGLVFAGKISRADDVTVVVRKIGREERIDDRDVTKWFPRSPVGWFVCRSSRNYDFKQIEPVLVAVEMLNTEKPSNQELINYMSHKEVFLALNGH